MEVNDDQTHQAYCLICSPLIKLKSILKGIEFSITSPSLFEYIQQKMSFCSQQPQRYPSHQIPGDISIISRENDTLHHPSLIQNIWEFDHDPEDNYIRNIFREKQDKYRSCQQIPHPLSSVQGQDTQRNRNYCYHSQLNIAKRDGMMPATGYGGHQVGAEYGIEQQQRGSAVRICSISPSNHSKSYRRKSSEASSLPRNKIRISSPTPENPHRSTLPLSALAYPHASTPQLPPELPQPIEYLHSNREIDIFSHRHISNQGLLIRQTKQLLNYHRSLQLQSETEMLRKKMMKLEIECRKLKIGLRNNSSSASGMLVELRKKEYFIGRAYSPKNGDTMQSKQPYQMDKQERELYECIKAEKKRNVELSAREALTSNYLAVMKNKISSVDDLLRVLCTEEEYQQHLQQISAFLDNTQNTAPINKITKNGNSTASHSPPLPLKKQSQFSTSLSSAGEKRTYQDILLTKKEILQNSLAETETYLNKKVHSTSDEIEILRKEIDIIAMQMEKVNKGESMEKLGETAVFGGSNSEATGYFNLQFNRKVQGSRKSNLNRNTVNMNPKKTTTATAATFKNSIYHNGPFYHEQSQRSTSKSTQRKLLFKSPFPTSLKKDRSAQKAQSQKKLPAMINRIKSTTTNIPGVKRAPVIAKTAVEGREEQEVRSMECLHINSLEDREGEGEGEGEREQEGEIFVNQQENSMDF